MATPESTNDGEIAATTTDEDDDNETVIEHSSSPKDESHESVNDSSYHLFEGRWTFWYTHRPTTFRNSSVNYDSCLKRLGQ